MPRTIKCTCPPDVYRDLASAFILLTKSDLFSINSMVSIYFVDDDYESLIGIGYVVNIQNNGVVQVLVTKTYKDHESIWFALKNNDASKISKVIVKPGLSMLVLKMEIQDE